MASWESKSWPLRRWLADRLIGKHAYSRNVVDPYTATGIQILQHMANRGTSSSGGKITVRNPGETA